MSESYEALKAKAQYDAIVARDAERLQAAERAVGALREALTVTFGHLQVGTSAKALVSETLDAPDVASLALQHDARVRKNERERCAREADKWAHSPSCKPPELCDHQRTGAGIAQAIREMEDALTTEPR